MDFGQRWTKNYFDILRTYFIHTLAFPHFCRNVFLSQFSRMQSGQRKPWLPVTYLIFPKVILGGHAISPHFNSKGALHHLITISCFSAAVNAWHHASILLLCFHLSVIVFMSSASSYDHYQTVCLQLHCPSIRESVFMRNGLISSFIHSFITEIYIVPLQGYYSKALLLCYHWTMESTDSFTSNLRVSFIFCSLVQLGILIFMFLDIIYLSLFMTADAYFRSLYRNITVFCFEQIWLAMSLSFWLIFWDAQLLTLV